MSSQYTRKNARRRFNKQVTRRNTVVARMTEDQLVQRQHAIARIAATRSA